jgi:hypothetical protein
MAPKWIQMAMLLSERRNFVVAFKWKCELKSAFRFMCATDGKLIMPKAT